MEKDRTERDGSMDRNLLEALDDMECDVDKTLKRFDGDEEFYLGLLEKFPDNQNIIKLRQAVDAGDCDTAQKEVHSLKGVALNLGLLPLVDVSMDMLLDFRAGKKELALSRMDAVEKRFYEVADLIKEYK